MSFIAQYLMVVFFVSVIGIIVVSLLDDQE